MSFPTLITLIISAIPVIYGVMFLKYRVIPKSKTAISAEDFIRRFLVILCITVGLLLFAYFSLDNSQEGNSSNVAGTPTVPTESITMNKETTPLTQCALLADTNAPDSTSDVCVGTWFDVHGNIYLDSIRFWVWDVYNMSATEYTIYQIDGKYATLNGTIVAESDSSPNAQFKIIVYLDGQLQYESQEIRADSQPSPISIDISNANTIRIECTTDTPYSGYCIFSASVS